MSPTLQWCHNEPDDVSNHQCLNCLLKPLLRRRSKKTSKLQVTGLCERNSPVTGELPHKGPVARKWFSFDDVIMNRWVSYRNKTHSLLIFYGMYCVFMIYPSTLGLFSLRRHHPIGIGIPIINLRQLSDHLRFIMGIPISIRHCLFSEHKSCNVVKSLQLIWRSCNRR